MSEEVFEQRMRLGRLFDLYGGLLTDKQRDCLNMYFYDDLSLSEISEELGVSRQAVHDLLKRVEQTLEKYENKLGLLAKNDADKEQLRTVIDLITHDNGTGKNEAVNILIRMCGEGR